MRNISYALCAALVLLAGPRAARAQRVPGGTPTDWDRVQADYTVDVLRAYNDLMTDWRDAWQHADVKRATALYTGAALMLVPDLDPIQGREAINTYLQTILPNVVEIRTGLSDFVASDRLAYALGPLWYQVKDASGHMRVITGTCVTILVREGGHWRIRSQVFRYGDTRENAGAN